MKKFLALIASLAFLTLYVSLQQAGESRISLCSLPADSHNHILDINPREARLYTISLSAATDSGSIWTTASLYKRLNEKDWIWVDGVQTIATQTRQTFTIQYLPSSWDHDRIQDYLLRFTQFQDVQPQKRCTDWFLDVKSHPFGDLGTLQDLPGLGDVRPWNNITLDAGGRLTVYVHDRFDPVDFFTFKVRPTAKVFNLTVSFEAGAPSKFTAAVGLVENQRTYGLASDRFSGRGSFTLSNLPSDNTYFIFLSVTEPDWGRGPIYIDYQLSYAEPETPPTKPTLPEIPLDQLLLVLLAVILFLYWLSGVKPQGPLAKLDAAASKLESITVRAARNIIRDENPVSIEPRATKAMLRLNLLLFAIMATNIETWVETAGFRPLFLHSPVGWMLLFTSMFIHANPAHVLGNTAFLITFGDNVEDALRSRARWLSVYLSSGLVAGLAHAGWAYFIGGPSAMLAPAVGASGAISGLMGFYLAHYPNARLVVAGRYRRQAAEFLTLWFISQAVLSLTSSEPIAYAAHAGGFIAGMTIGFLTRRRAVR